MPFSEKNLPPQYTVNRLRRFFPNDQQCSDLDITTAHKAISRREFLLGAGLCAGMFIVSIPCAGAQDSASAKVGFLIPKDGPHSREAKSLVDGFELFLKESGQGSVEILKKDLAPKDANIAELLADLLIKRQVQFLVGPPTLEGSEKCIHGMAGSSAILFVTHPSVRLVSGELCQNNIFRLLPNTYQSAQPLASWALKNLGRKVFITGQDDAQGNEEADFFAYGFDRVGGSFVDRTMFSENTDKMKPLAESIVKAKPDLVFAAFRQKNSVDFIKTLRTVCAPLLEKTIGPESLLPFPESVQNQGKNFLGVENFDMVEKSDGACRSSQENLWKRAFFDILSGGRL